MARTGYSWNFVFGLAENAHLSGAIVFTVSWSIGALARLLDSTHLHRKHGDRSAVHAFDQERDRLRRHAGAEET